MVLTFIEKTNSKPAREYFIFAREKQNNLFAVLKSKGFSFKPPHKRLKRKVIIINAIN
jgi:L-rhamnose mutarotase